MLFTTWQFALAFLPLALGVFFLIPASAAGARKVWLTLASLFFYAAWRVEYLPLLLASIGFNFTIAELLCRWRGTAAARQTLRLGVAGNLLALAYFKYTNFLLAAAGLALHRPAPQFDIILPLAISFFTFTQISYLVDVSRDERLHYGFLDYALFVAFFPHLIAGPIVRHWEIIPQYAQRTLRFTRENLAVGLTLFLLGCAKKVLLADTAAPYADAIFGSAQAGASLPWLNAWAGVLAYALQIYFDFSGYSDMALGLARLFDLRFPVNFHSPYRAASVAEFWQRWHITLTRFLREYVYIPLGGNRCPPARQAANVLATFLLSGLWHGAAWTFLVWGLLHGLALLAHQQWVRLRLALRWAKPGAVGRGIARLVTFAFILLTWVWFRAPDVATARHLTTTLLGAHGFTRSLSLPAGSPLDWLLHTLGLTTTAPGLPLDLHATLVLATLLALAWFAPNTQQLLARFTPALEPVTAPRLTLRLGLPAGLALGVLTFLIIRTQSSSVPSPFLYFNF